MKIEIGSKSVWALSFERVAAVASSTSESAMLAVQQLNLLRDKGLAEGYFDEDEYLELVRGVLLGLLAASGPALAARVGTLLSTNHASVRHILRELELERQAILDADKNEWIITDCNRIIWDDYVFAWAMTQVQVELEARGLISAVEKMKGMPELVNYPFRLRAGVKRLLDFSCVTDEDFDAVQVAFGAMSERIAADIEKGRAGRMPGK